MSQAGFKIDDAAVAEAEAALAALAEEYPVYARSDVDEMTLRAASILRGTVEGRDVSSALTALHGIAHNVKGQGASFGYDLMTRFGEAICEITRHRASVSADEARRIGALVAACGTVIAARLTGWGGGEGRRLLTETGLAAPEH